MAQDAAVAAQRGARGVRPTYTGLGERRFSQALRLANRRPRFPRSYIHCTKKVGPAVFQQFADRFHADPAWRFDAMDASRSPNVTAPEALAELLIGLT